MEDSFSDSMDAHLCTRRVVDGVLRGPDAHLAPERFDAVLESAAAFAQAQSIGLEGFLERARLAWDEVRKPRW